MKTRNQIILAIALVLVAVGAVAVYGMGGEAQEGGHRPHGRSRPFDHGCRGGRGTACQLERGGQQTDRCDLCHRDQRVPSPDGAHRRLRHLRRDPPRHRESEDRRLGGEALRGLHRSSGTCRPTSAGGVQPWPGDGPGGVAPGQETSFGKPRRAAGSGPGKTPRPSWPQPDAVWPTGTSRRRRYGRSRSEGRCPRP